MDRFSACDRLNSNLKSLELAMSTRRLFLEAGRSEFINRYGVKVVEGVDMLVSARVVRIGHDEQGDYALIGLNGNNVLIKVSIDQIVGVDNTPTLV